MPTSLPFLDDKVLGRVIDDDLDVLFLGVLQLPVRGFEKATRFARHHLDVLGTDSQ